eukprot:2737257-Lingulodinium_polyedra.AAC.1
MVAHWPRPELLYVAPQVLVPVAAALSEEDFAVALPPRPAGNGDGHLADVIQGGPAPLLAR